MLDEIAIVAIISGVTQAVKTAFLPNKMAGLFAIVLGVIVSFGVNHAFTFDTAILGVMYGLSASGTYEGVSLVTPKVTKFVGKMVK